jgi:hypothetical protein
LISLIYIRQFKHKKVTDDFIKILNKNVDFLTELSRKQETIQLKNTIKLYSQFQVILKISKCDYISFFKYDYSKRYVILHFLLSTDEKGSIIQESMLDKLPATSNLLTLNIINSDDTDLHSINASEIREKDDKVYQIMKYRNISKMYYQNIFKDMDNPLGFIALSYIDENFIIPEADKIEILRIIEKIKSFL